MFLKLLLQGYPAFLASLVHHLPERAVHRRLAPGQDRRVLLGLQEGSHDRPGDVSSDDRIEAAIRRHGPIRSSDGRVLIGNYEWTFEVSEQLTPDQLPPKLERMGVGSTAHGAAPGSSWRVLTGFPSAAAPE